MTTMELEAQKAILAREILNTDSSQFIKEMTKAYHRIKAKIQKDHTIEQDNKEYAPAEESSFSSVVSETACSYGCIENDIETNSDECIIEGIKEALHTLNEIKAGRIKTRPAREILEELRKED